MTASPAVLPPAMRVVASVRALRAARQLTTDEVRNHIHVSRTTWFERMQKGNFTITEVIALAELFGVTVQSLVDGKVTLPYRARTLELVQGGGRATAVTQPPIVASVPTSFTTN